MRQREKFALVSMILLATFCPVRCDDGEKISNYWVGGLLLLSLIVLMVWIHYQKHVTLKKYDSRPASDESVEGDYRSLVARYFGSQRKSSLPSSGLWNGTTKQVGRRRPLKLDLQIDPQGNIRGRTQNAAGIQGFYFEEEVCETSDDSYYKELPGEPVAAAIQTKSTNTPSLDLDSTHKRQIAWLETGKIHKSLYLGTVHRNPSGNGLLLTGTFQSGDGLPQGTFACEYVSNSHGSDNLASGFVLGAVGRPWLSENATGQRW